jgi:hypothetical protein
MSENKSNENEKMFGLKPIELQLVSNLQQGYFNNLSTTLSFIALERLAYEVTPSTRFRIEDGNLYIHEEEVKEEQVA